MKRDMDLVRKILLKIEESAPFETVQNLTIENYDMQEVAYHCEMMYQKGLIKEYQGDTVDNYNGVISFYVADLTWEGQDFLETVRDNSVWKKTKDTLKKKGLPLVIETIKTISTEIITAAAEGVANAIVNNGGLA